MLLDLLLLGELNELVGFLLLELLHVGYLLWLHDQLFRVDVEQDRLRILLLLALLLLLRSD